MTFLAIKLIAPSQPEHILITSFFFPPTKNPESTTLVHPIIRPEVQEATSERGEHILVYYNNTIGVENVVKTLSNVNASFIVYNFATPAYPEDYPNIVFKQPSVLHFLDDLARSSAVICTAGFTLISEAMYLGKPVLVVPNRGVFEQTLNALFLSQSGLGAAVMDRPVSSDDVQRFIERRENYEARISSHPTSGNKEAVECIESVLSRIGPKYHKKPDFSLKEYSNASIMAPLEHVHQL